jgi:hypothetical protein
MDKNKYLLKSSAFKKMMGYTSQKDIENDDMELFYQIIHPDDLPFVLETGNRAFCFFKNLPAPEKKTINLSTISG